MRRRSSFAILAVSASSLAVAGCGGGGISKSDYAHKLKHVLKPLGSHLQSIGNDASRSTTKPQLESALRAGEAALRRAIDGVKEISPPSDVARTQRSLVDVLATYKSSFDDAEAAVASGPNDVNHEPARVMSKIDDFQTASSKFATRLKRIPVELKREGVPVHGAGD